MKKALALLLTLACVLALAGCTVRSTTQLVEKSVSTLQEITDAALDPETDAPESGDTFVTAENPEEQQMLPEEEAVLLPEDTEISQTSDTLDEHGSYYDAESVVLYLDTYGHLPDNYMTKEEARALGLLPEADGRTYTECDINTNGADSRGAERLIFSNDGLYFYTSDHYASFTELTVDGGQVVWNR